MNSNDPFPVHALVIGGAQSGSYVQVDNMFPLRIHKENFRPFLVEFQNRAYGFLIPMEVAVTQSEAYAYILAELTTAYATHHNGIMI